MVSLVLRDTTGHDYVQTQLKATTALCSTQQPPYPAGADAHGLPAKIPSPHTTAAFRCRRCTLLSRLGRLRNLSSPTPSALAPTPLATTTSKWLICPTQPQELSAATLHRLVPRVWTSQGKKRLRMRIRPFMRALLPRGRHSCHSCLISSGSPASKSQLNHHPPTSGHLLRHILTNAFIRTYLHFAISWPYLLFTNLSTKSN